MAVQITGRQIANAAVDVNKLDLSTGTFDFTSAVLQVAAPSSGSDAATKTYVDSIAQGLHWKDSVRVATTGNITLSGTQTIDGIAVVADDRVLVKNQTDQTENGIYLCKAGSWERSADMDAGSEFSGAAVFVQEGTANADTGYVCSNDGNVTIGTDNILFVQFTGAGQLDGGNGIDITGSTVSVDLDSASGLAVSASGLKIDALGVTNAMLAGSIANAKLANSTISGVSLGSNLNSLSAGNGISMTSFNGSAAVSDLTIDLDTNSGLIVNPDGLSIDLDGASLALGAGGLSIAADGVTATEIADGAIDASAKIADSVVTNAKLANSSVSFGGVSLSLGGSDATPAFDLTDATNYPTSSLVGTITNAQLAGSIAGSKLLDNAITTAKIADDSVTTQKLDIVGIFSAFDADGSTSAFSLQGGVDLDLAESFVVTVNGLVVEYKATPDGKDNYKIDNGGVGDVGRVVFGANLDNGDRVCVRGLVNNPA